jgi:hypothetical protein
MWPLLSSFFCYLTLLAAAIVPLDCLVGACPCDGCWWLRDPWGFPAPNDLLSVSVTLDRTPDPACALGACEALG